MSLPTLPAPAALAPPGPLPEPSPAEGTARRRDVVLVFAGATLCLLTTLVGLDRKLFTAKLYANGDAAAVAILVKEAKQGRLLVGNYSCKHFHHPGPALLYVHALAEGLLYDWLPIAPLPRNAHIMAAAALHAALLGLALALLYTHWRSWLAVLTALAVFLGYCGLTGVIAEDWFPNLYFSIFLAFAVATASVASGQVRHLPWLGLTGSLAIHGHVGFVAFVFINALYALYRVLRLYHFNVRRLLAENRRAFVAFAIIVGLFVLPILLHTALHFPGEIGKYLAYSRSEEAGLKKWPDAFDYLLRCLTSSSPHRQLLAVGLALAGGVVCLRRVSGAQVTVVRNLLAIGLLTSVAFLGYAYTSVGSADDVYPGIFFGSVFLLVLTTVVMSLAMWARRSLYATAALALAAGVVIIVAPSRERFRNPKFSQTELPALIEALEQEQPGSEAPTVISFDADLWGAAIGFVLEMDRRGKPVYVADDSWALIFTERFTRLPEDLWRRQPRLLDFARPGDASGRVVFHTAEYDLQEADLPYRLGATLSFPRHRRFPSLHGWPEASWTGDRAEMALAIAPVLEDAKLTVVAEGFVGDQHPRTSVNVIVNDQVVGRWTFEAGQGPVHRSAVLPAELVNRQRPLHIAFEAPDACSPSELGLGQDSRRRGMKIHELWLCKVRAD